MTVQTPPPTVQAGSPPAKTVAVVAPPAPAQYMQALRPKMRAA